MKSVTLPLILPLIMLLACSKSFQNEAERPYCGRAIVDGTLVEAQDPFSKKVALLLADESSCTATPISSNVLLTAAHCVYGKKEMHVVFGDTFQCQVAPHTNPQTRKVLSSRIYENFNDDIFKSTDLSKVKNDIALIKIEGTVPSDFYISSLYDGRSRLQSDDLILIGYGDSRDNSDEPPRLRKVKKSFSKALSRSSEPQQLFLEQRSHGGICLGDSGGPQFILVNGVYKILGINSAVSGPQSSPCHGQAILMYGPYFYDWVVQTTLELR